METEPVIKIIHIPGLDVGFAQTQSGWYYPTAPGKTEGPFLSLELASFNYGQYVQAKSNPFQDSPVIAALKQELEYQNDKWGKEKQQSLAGYLLIAEKELREAIEGWNKNHAGRDSCLSECIQVMAVLFRCCSTYGVTGVTVSSSDRLSVHSDELLHGRESLDPTKPYWLQHLSDQTKRS